MHAQVSQHLPLVATLTPTAMTRSGYWHSPHQTAYRHLVDLASRISRTRLGCSEGSGSQLLMYWCSPTSRPA